MNPLSWFKEFALRANTQRMMDQASEQAKTDRENILGTIIRQDEDEKLRNATIQGGLERERIQQAGETDRYELTHRYQAAKDAAAEGKRITDSENVMLDNAKSMKSEAAIRGYLSGGGARPFVVQAAVDDFNARKAGEKPVDFERDRFENFVKATKTEKALRAIIAAYPQYKDSPAVAAHLADVRASDSEAADVRNHRNKPPAPPKPDIVTDPERLSYWARRDKLTQQLQAGGFDTPEQEQAIRAEIASINARLAPPNPSNADLLKGFLSVLGATGAPGKK